MRAMRIAFGVAMILSVALVARPSAECVTVTVPDAKPPTIRQLMAQYHLVFRGTVIRTEKYGDTVFDVDRVWKGHVKREASFSFAEAEYHWPRVGDTYLMLMWRCRECGRKEPIYQTGCDGGLHLDDEEAQLWLKQLGPGKPSRE